MSLAVKLLLNFSSLSLHDALHIFPTTSHSHLLMFSTKFPFPNFRPCTQNEQRRHSNMITQLW